MSVIFLNVSLLNAVVLNVLASWSYEAKWVIIGLFSSPLWTNYWIINKKRKTLVHNYV
jgi:hypothetical protein